MNHEAGRGDPHAYEPGSGGPYAYEPGSGGPYAYEPGSGGPHAYEPGSGAPYGYGPPPGYPPPAPQYVHHTNHTAYARYDMTKGRLSGTDKTRLILFGIPILLVLLCCVGGPLSMMFGGSASSPAGTQIPEGVAVSRVDVRARTDTHGYVGYVTVRNDSDGTWSVGYATLRFVLKKDGRVVVVLNGENSSGKTLKPGEEWVVEVSDYSTPYEAGPYQTSLTLE